MVIRISLNSSKDEISIYLDWQTKRVEPLIKQTLNCKGWANNREVKQMFKKKARI
jgi:hypothetical protein